MTFALFGYQEEALAAEAAYRREHPEENRLAIVLPTGTGKGTILAERAVRFIEDPMSAGQCVLILVHTDELVQDLAARCTYAAGRSEFPISVGIVKAGQDDTDADIIVGSAATLAGPRRRERIQGVGLVIVDECHHGTADTYQAILRHFGCMPCAEQCDRHGGMCHVPEYAVPALGFTATLERGDGQGLGTVWQNVVYSRDIRWAVRKGYLKQPIGYRLEIELAGELGGADSFEAGMGNMQALDIQVGDSIAPERIVEKWIELAMDRQTIVFAPLVRSAYKIRDAFVNALIPAAVVHGDMNNGDRREVVRLFKAGEIPVLVNAMVLTEGFDHPNVSCVIVARPTQSRPLFIQMAGRGLRRIPGVPVEDQDCILITLADGTSDICSIADLSDRPLDRKSDGALTVMEDEWDIGAGIEDAARHWTGRVDATQFDPIVARSSKVWSKTKAGHWFLPISTDKEYVFLLDTSIYLLTRPVKATSAPQNKVKVRRLHAGLPDLELAMLAAEDEAIEHGGDIGALLADKSRPWRRERPAADSKIINKAKRLGLQDEIDRIMSAQAGGKAGKISDLIRRVEASRTIDTVVEQINARKATA